MAEPLLCECASAVTEERSREVVGAEALWAPVRSTDKAQMCEIVGEAADAETNETEPREVPFVTVTEPREVPFVTMAGDQGECVPIEVKMPKGKA